MLLIVIQISIKLTVCLVDLHEEINMITSTIS